MYFLLASALLCMTVITILNVLSRNLLHMSIAYTEELAVGLFVWLTFLGTGIGIVEGLHVSVEIVKRKAGPKLRLGLQLLSLLSFAIFLLILTVWGAKMAQREWLYNQTTLSLGWPLWVFGLSVPVGSVVGLYYTFKQTLAVIRGRDQ